MERAGNEEKTNMNFRKVVYILKVKAKINKLEILNILKMKLVADYEIIV